MISRVRGRLLRRDMDVVEVMTAAGVAYEISVPITVFERLPREGEDVELRTYHVVREDAQELYGFLDGQDRELFGRLLGASGVGPRLALAMLSTLAPDRLVAAIRDRDLAALKQVPGLGTKKAEKIGVELSGKLDDLAYGAGATPRGRAAEEAVGALVSLGYASASAGAAVRRALDADGTLKGPALIKAALAEVGR